MFGGSWVMSCSMSRRRSHSASDSATVGGSAAEVVPVAVEVERLTFGMRYDDGGRVDVETGAAGGWRLVGAVVAMVGGWACGGGMVAWGLGVQLVGGGSWSWRQQPRTGVRERVGVEAGLTKYTAWEAFFLSEQTWCLGT